MGMYCIYTLSPVSSRKKSPEFLGYGPADRYELCVRQHGRHGRQTEQAEKCPRQRLQSQGARRDTQQLAPIRAERPAGQLPGQPAPAATAAAEW